MMPGRPDGGGAARRAGRRGRRQRAPAEVGGPVRGPVAVRHVVQDGTRESCGRAVHIRRRGLDVDLEHEHGIEELRQIAQALQAQNQLLLEALAAKSREVE
jgi:hypothetical protein